MSSYTHSQAIQHSSPPPSLPNQEADSQFGVVQGGHRYSLRTRDVKRKDPESDQKGNCTDSLGMQKASGVGLASFSSASSVNDGDKTLRRKTETSLSYARPKTDSRIAREIEMILAVAARELEKFQDGISKIDMKAEDSSAEVSKLENLLVQEIHIHIRLLGTETTPAVKECHLRCAWNLYNNIRNKENHKDTLGKIVSASIRSQTSHK